MWVEASWLALALIHAPPSAATFSAGLRKRMYGVDESGPLGVILVHRGVLFLAVFAACVFAAFNTDARALASIVTAISLVGFLIVYALAKAPRGSLRAVALTDAVGLIPLAVVLFDAWVA
jgi:hypothetical protein